MSAKKKKSDDEEGEPLIEFNEDTIDKINISWEEFVNEVTLSEKSINCQDDEKKCLAEAIIEFEQYFDKGQKVELK